MRTIEIDFEVFKALTARRETEAVTNNDVIRELLGLGRVAGSAPPAAPPTGSQSGGLLCKGVFFPEGTEIRKDYKGVMYSGKVHGGKFMINGINGKTAISPSDAARIVTKNNVNGWNFWECRLPDETRWRPIGSLRKGKF